MRRSGIFRFLLKSSGIRAYIQVSGAKRPDAAVASIAVCVLSGPIGWGALAVVAGTGAARLWWAEASPRR